MRQWRLSRIAALLLLSMMLAADVKANKFYVQWASFTQLPMNGTEIQVYLEAEARYMEELSWTDGNERDGFLVLDVNRNGRIDDGTELFGNHSWLLDGSKSPHGYRALAEYDKEEAGGNADGFIDEGDFVFVMLRVWLDEDHDGIADDVEMLTMEEAGVLKLDLDYRENRSRDPHGNRLRFNSRAWIAHDGSGSLPAKSTDVFFVVKD